MFNSQSLSCLDSCDNCQKLINVKEENIKPNIGAYLEPSSHEELQQLLIPDKILSRYIKLLDIVNYESTKSCCFTKGYIHFVLKIYQLIFGPQHVMRLSTSHSTIIGVYMTFYILIIQLWEVC